MDKIEYSKYEDGKFNFYVKIIYKQYNLFGKLIQLTIDISAQEYYSSPVGKAELIKQRFSQNKPLPI